MTRGLAPKQIVRVTERLGFFATANAMKQMLERRVEGSDEGMPLRRDRLNWPVTSAARIRFMQFRRRTDPFG